LIRTTFNTTSSRTPSVTIHPTALFSILDHYLRRTNAQQRVIGTLLGTRNEGDNAVSVRTAFAVLHSETSEQVAVDMDYHRAMFELSHRVNPKESIVGWCAFALQALRLGQDTDPTLGDPGIQPDRI